MSVEKAQEIVPLLGRELGVNCHASSEPNTARNQANALGNVNHYVVQVVHRLATLAPQAIQDLDLQLMRCSAQGKRGDLHVYISARYIRPFTLGFGLNGAT
jgi:hypothetical protein